MKQVRKITNILRKALLIGWALAVIWIYLGNLVNFHLYRIWGKQLMPVECSSTRGKEKGTASFVKTDRNSKHIDSGSHFDFTFPGSQSLQVVYIDCVSQNFGITDTPVLHLGIQAFSFRGPPTA
jgi:hypothetical protein